MGAGISHAQQYRREYAGLHTIMAELSANGVACRYANRAVYSVPTAQSRLLGIEFSIFYNRSNASNGECCLYPVIRVITPTESISYWGWTGAQGQHTYDDGVKFIVDTLGNRKAKAGLDFTINKSSDRHGSGL